MPNPAAEQFAGSLDAAAPPLATSYDEIPYPRLAFPYTHPSHLATIGRLLGLLPAPVDRCRVLELGCAGGANLVPMAYAIPSSTWVGIDLSERQIAEGRAFADALGLTNVVLEQLDICEAAESLADRFGPFDYIIAHGIYSWVPDLVKQALLVGLSAVACSRGNRVCQLQLLSRLPVARDDPADVPVSWPPRIESASVSRRRIGRFSNFCCKSCRRATIPIEPRCANKRPACSPSAMP